MEAEVSLSVVDLAEMADFKFIGVHISLEENGDKKVVGRYKDWINVDCQELHDRYNQSKETKKWETIALCNNGSVLWIDTDEQEQYSFLVDLLKEQEIYNEMAITPSYKNKKQNLYYKNHFWFSVISGDEEYNIPHNCKQYNGFDIIYKGGFLYEYVDSYICSPPVITQKKYEYILKEMNKKFPPKNKPKIVIKPRQVPEVIPDEVINETTEVPVVEPHLERLLNGLSVSRWVNYDTWIRIGMIFLNEELSMDIFHYFSKLKCSDKFDKTKNEECIARLKRTENGLKIATLYKWLKEDNPQLYNELQGERQDFWSLITPQFKLQHSDFAKLYYNIEPNKYVRSNLSGWYEYNEYFVLQHRDEIPSSLKNDITTKLQSYIIEQRNSLKPDCERYDEKMKLVKVSYGQVGNSVFVNGIIDYLKNYYTVERLDELLDADNSLLAFDDKLYDIKTNEFRNIRPSDFITKTCRYKAPSTVIDTERRKLFYKILYSIFEEDYDEKTGEVSTEYSIKRDGKTISGESLGMRMTEYYLMNTGLCLFTNKQEQFIILSGNGGNGKGLLSSAIKSVLGDYEYTVENTFLTTSFKAGAPNPSLFACRGIRYLSVSEPDNGSNDSKFNVDFIKSMSGGDPITCRTLFAKKNITYVPQFTVFVQCNQKPKLGKMDKGVKRRIKIIDHPYSFVDNPKLPIERKINYSLKAELTKPEMRDEICRILIETAYKYYKTFSNQIIPLSVREENDEYFYDNDFVKQWIDQFCDLTNSSSDKIKAQDAYKHYISKMEKISQSDFCQSMKINNIPFVKPGGVKYYTGIKFKPVAPLINDTSSNDYLPGLNPDSLYNLED